jgi:YesN/AraC family two-component response regulator
MNEQGTAKGKILIADDDEAFRTATKVFLRRQGFDCESAKDGSSAIELLRNTQFDLLISDINMPGNVSLELIEKLPEIAAALPVILLTGHPSVQSAARSVRLQIVAYLVKPCDANELLSLAEQAIANYRAFRAVSSNRLKLETWARDLRQIEEVIQKTPASASNATTEAYLNLTLSNILSLLLDLKRFTEALAYQPRQKELLGQVTLHRALMETIEVLEKTKQSFKSKELGELRRKLESILQTLPTGDRRVEE